MKFDGQIIQIILTVVLSNKMQNTSNIPNLFHDQIMKFVHLNDYDDDEPTDDKQIYS